MDFTRSETQAAVAEAVAGALSAAAPDEQLLTALPSRGIDDTGFDEPLWRAFAGSGLLSLPLSADLGGDDLTVADVAVAIEEVGRAGVVIPAMETLGFGVLPIVAFGTSDQRRALLADLDDGRILTAATGESGRPLPGEPATALVDGVLDGAVTGVRYAAEADVVLVPTSSGIAAVSPRASGVTLTPTPGSLGVPEYAMRFAGVRVDADRVLTDGDSTTLLADFHRLLVTAITAAGDGLVSGALRMTADYLRGREQFGRPLGAFQAVQQQLADVYIVSQNLHNLARSVAWRVTGGLVGPRDDHGTDPTVASWWLAAEGPRAVQILHHLHGGVGVDVTYPMFRFSSAVKDLARFVGGADHQLTALTREVTGGGRGASGDDGPGPTRPANGESGAPAGTEAPDGTEAPAVESGFIDLTPGQRALESELSRYFAQLVSREEAVEIATHRHGDAYSEVVRRMGRDGWLGVGWPSEYGGRGFGHIEQQIFTNSAARADVPLPSVTLQTVGPTLQRYGTEEQKEAFLPGILSGELHFAIGYSEPDAGTDLASLRTTAKRDEATGDWIINGQKMWTTGGHHADFIWLAARTGAPDSRHRGLTIFIVDTSDPGFSHTPIITCDGAHHVNATYFSDVRVPANRVVGEVDGGWKMLTTQLNHERVMLAPAGRLALYYDKMTSWAECDRSDSTHPVDLPDVQAQLARVEALYRINVLLNWQLGASGDDPSMADSAAAKVFATEAIQVVGRIFEDLLARHGDPFSEHTRETRRWLDMMNKRNVVITFGGGVNEVMRELVCMGGLGMPRTAR